jgi:potassium efflux system protein
MKRSPLGFGTPFATACVLVLLLATAGRALSAQEAEPTTPRDTAQARVPRPIPATDIPERALGVGTALAGFRVEITADTVLRGAATALTDLARQIETVEANLDPVQLQGQSLDNLAELERQWRVYEREVGTWEERLGTRSTQLDAVRDRLLFIQATWQMTRDSTRREDLPPELRERIASILLSADSVHTRLRGPREEVLTQLDQASQLQVRITEALATIRAAQDAARRRLLVRDHPPVWRIFTPDSAATAPTGSLAQKLAPAWAYFGAHSGRLVYQLLVFLALFGAVLALRRRSVRWVTAEHLIHSPAQLFARPASAAFLVALAATRIIHPDAPRAVSGITWILAIPALLLLLPTAVDREVRRPTYLFAALFTVSILVDLTIGHPLLGRLAVLALTVSAIAILLHVVRLDSTVEQARQSAWWRAARRSMWLGVALLAGGALGNLLGYVALSRVWLGAVVTMAFAAIVFIALATVLTGIYVVFLETTLSQALRVVQAHRRTLVRRGRALIRLGLLAWWLTLVLHQLRIRELVWRDIGIVLGHEWAIGSWSISFGEIFTFAIAVWLGIAVAGATRALLREDVLPRLELPRGVPDTISSVAYYALMALGFLFAVGAAGIDLSRITILVGALGVGIGFGLQNIVNNFISGLILLFERPIQMGDTIEVGGLMGNVQVIGIRASTVRTFDGAEVIVPNADLISTQVTNWTLSDKLRRIEVPIGVAYGSDPKQVLTILREVATRHPRLLTNPEPAALFVGFGDSSLDFSLRAWTAEFETWLHIRSDLYTQIYEALAEAGIAIPFPQRDLHLRSVDRGAAEALRPQGPALSDP